MTLVRGACVVGGDVQGQGLRRESYFYEGPGGTRRAGASRLCPSHRARPGRRLTQVEDYLQDPLAYDRIGALSLLTLKQRTRGRFPSRASNWSRARLRLVVTRRRSFPFVASPRPIATELDGMQVLRIAEYNTFDAFGTLVRRR